MREEIDGRDEREIEGNEEKEKKVSNERRMGGQKESRERGREQRERKPLAYLWVLPSTLDPIDIQIVLFFSFLSSAFLLLGKIFSPPPTRGLYEFLLHEYFLSPARSSSTICFSFTATSCLEFQRLVPREQ